MKNIEISDVDFLAEIHGLSFEKKWSADDFSQMLASGLFFGFIEDRGFILGRNVLDEVEIFTICVAPKSRNKKIATALLQKFNAYAKESGAKVVFLEVDSDNTFAQRLYLSNGYQQISMRHNYYGSHDAIIMKLDLK